MKRHLSSDSNMIAEKEEEEAQTSKSAFDGKTKNRLGNCEVCAKKEALYTCPKCEVKTCSIDCVQIHKKELECNGLRDRTKFIPIRQMTNMDFMSDYYFLEECVRYAQDRRRDPLKSYTHYNKVLPTHLFRLRRAAAERHTTLRFLLQNFTRHKENSTYYDWKLYKIYWRVEWIFVNANSAKFVDERCDEELPLHQLLKKYVNPSSSQDVPQKQLLQFYQSVGAFGLKILLKAEGIKRCRQRYYQLDASKTLRQNLAHKTLVEFPIIYLSYEQHTAGFDVIDSDEDVEAETKSHEAALERIKAQQIEAALKAAQAALEEENSEDKNSKGKPPNKRVKKEHTSEQILKESNNFLFTDERLLDVLSSDSDDGNETEEEKNCT